MQKCYLTKDEKRRTKNEGRKTFYYIDKNPCFRAAPYQGAQNVIVIVIVVKIWHSDKFLVSLHDYEQLQGTRAHGVGTTLLPPTRWDSRMEKITALDQHLPAAQRRTQTTGLHGQAAHVHAPSGKPHCALFG